MAFFVRKAGRLHTARTVAPLHGPGSLGCHATFAVTPRSTSAWQGRAHLKTYAVPASIPQRTRRPSRFRREPPAREKRVLAIPQRAAHNFQEAIRASLLDAIPRPLD